jgi:predicted DNA-binding protein YlxM (UPF0122 family)
MDKEVNIVSRHKRESAYLHKQEEWKELYESGMSYTQIGKKNGVHYTTVQTVLKDVVKPRPKQKFAHLAKEWVELYTINQYSINQIAEQYKTDPVTVSKYLKQEGVELRRQYGQSSPHEAHIPQWIKDYESGKSLKEIADEYETFPQTVHKHIKDKVEMREYTETSRMYEILHPDYLHTIDSHEKAYWLGIWYGTGFLSKSVGGYESTLTVGIKDQSTLERFKNLIGFDKPLEEYREKEIHVTKLRIHNKTFYDTLFSHGLRGDKTSTMSFPTKLGSEFYNSFVLGFYEGKGSCYISTGVVNGVGYKHITFQLFGNSEFLDSLKRVIKEALDIEIHKGVNKGKDKEDVHYLRTGAKDTIIKIADWLYNGNTTHAEHRDVRNILKQI